MKVCLFCKIIKGEIPSTKVYDDENFISIVDIQPKAPVHILTMPKTHMANLDTTNAVDAVLLGKMLLVCKKLAEEQGVGGAYKLVMNIGEMAGQTVMHMHIHLLGGWKSKDEVVSELKQ